MVSTIRRGRPLKEESEKKTVYFASSPRSRQMSPEAKADQPTSLPVPDSNIRGGGNGEDRSA